jgi:hypothetical protein
VPVCLGYSHGTELAELLIAHKHMIMSQLQEMLIGASSQIVEETLTLTHQMDEDEMHSEPFAFESWDRIEQDFAIVESVEETSDVSELRLEGDEGNVYMSGRMEEAQALQDAITASSAEVAVREAARVEVRAVGGDMSPTLRGV